MLSLMDQRVATLQFVPCRHQCFSQLRKRLPKIRPRPVQGRIVQEGARASARNIVCIQLYTHIITYQQLTYSCRQAREGRAPGALSIYKPTVLFDDGQKKKLLEQVKEKGY